MHLKVIKLIIFFWFCSSIFSNPKIELPSYEEGKKVLQILLKKYFPIPEYQEENQNWEILEYKQKRILKKVYNNSFIYYYRYKIKIPVYEKRNENYILTDYRTEEVWLRVAKDSSWSLTFLREDLLPGNFPIFVE